jgi:HEAT repeat protein
LTFCVVAPSETARNFMTTIAGNQRTRAARFGCILLLGAFLIPAAPSHSRGQASSSTPQYAGKSAETWSEILAENLDGQSKEEKDLCQKAARALGQIGPAASQAVPILMRAIAVPAVDVQRPAIDALGRIGPPARTAVPAIIAEVDLPKDHINYAPLTHFRRLAARALGRIGPDAAEAIPVLERALDNEDYVYRVEAALALWRISQYPQALDVLQAVIRENPAEGPYEAIMALPKLGPVAREAVPTLVATLKHEDPDTRRAAAKVLAGLGLGVLSPVATLLRDDTPQNPQPAAYVLGELLGELRQKAFDNRQIGTDTLRRAVAPVLQVAAPALIQLLSDERDDVREVAVQSLSQLGLLGVHVLLPVLNSQDQRARQSAIEALARLEEYLPEQWPASDFMETIKSRQIEVLTSLMEAGEPKSRVAAFRVFDQLKFTAVSDDTQQLLRNALRDKNVSIRRYAFEALQRVRSQPDADEAS